MHPFYNSSLFRQNLSVGIGWVMVFGMIGSIISNGFNLFLEGWSLLVLSIICFGSIIILNLINIKFLTKEEYTNFLISYEFYLYEKKWYIGLCESFLWIEILVGGIGIYTMTQKIMADVNQPTYMFLNLGISIIMLFSALNSIRKPYEVRMHDRINGFTK